MFSILLFLLSTSNSLILEQYSNVSLPFINTAPSQCPPPNFNSISPFNLTKYISNRWYIQEQMNVAYLQQTDNYCVTARYAISNSQSLWNSVTSLFGSNNQQININVYNYANQNQVNGPIKSAQLSAVVTNPNDGSKLLVGPSFVPELFYGPYWVITAGQYSNATSDEYYDYAIISGGPPSLTGEGGYCRTETGVNHSGLWLFTRAQLVDASVVEELRQLAKGFGFDIGVLNHVEQEGCLYTNVQ